jgi:kynurenine formamidase
MHKVILAIIAALLVAGLILFALYPTSHAPEKGAGDKPSGTVEPSRSLPQFDESKVVDLTYNFDDQAIYWPTAKAFQWEKEAWGKSAGGYWYTAARYSASEHGGTHLDAPIHFGEGRSAADEIPLSRLIAPAVVIDISPASARDADYRLTVGDIASWEKQNGQIPDNSIVLIRTGWGKFWPDRKKYLGTDAPGDTANLHFPGISREAAELLAKQRKIDGIGIDTASIDHGPSKDFIAHQVLNGANIYALENVANLDRLPAKGATLIALPLKIKGGTGGPVRIIAILP